MQTEAISLGTDLALDPTDPAKAEQIRKFSGGEGLTGAVDCSGQSVAHHIALDGLAPMGKLALVAEAATLVIRRSDQLILKQLTVFGPWYVSINACADTFQVIAMPKITMERLATHTLTLHEADTAYRMVDARETEKAVFVRQGA